MSDERKLVTVNLTVEQANEVLLRCLQSAGDDTPAFREALRVLAWSLEKSQSHPEEEVA